MSWHLSVADVGLHICFTFWKKKIWLTLPKIGVYHGSRAPALTPEGELAGRPTTASFHHPRHGRCSSHVVSLVSPAGEGAMNHPKARLQLYLVLRFAITRSPQLPSPPPS